MTVEHMDGTQLALITGAASGLGREVARQLGAVGMRTVITSRSPDHAAATAAEIGAIALEVGLDVADDDSVNIAARAVEEQFGRLDVLVNNAAAYVDWTETVSGASLADARRVLETNLFGAWRLTQALLPMLLAGSAPRIVNVSSGAGSHGDAQFWPHRPRRRRRVLRHQQSRAQRHDQHSGCRDPRHQAARQRRVSWPDRHLPRRGSDGRPPRRGQRPRRRLGSNPWRGWAQRRLLPRHATLALVTASTYAPHPRGGVLTHRP